MSMHGIVKLINLIKIKLETIPAHAFAEIICQDLWSSKSLMMSLNIILIIDFLLLLMNTFMFIKCPYQNSFMMVILS